MNADRVLRERIQSRFGWIEACLRWAGRFGVNEKKAYRDVFGLTDSMVSRDQALFRQCFNEYANADVVERERGRLLFKSPEHVPLVARFPEPDLLRWLKEVLGPSGFVDVPPIHRAPPKPEILQPVISAILGRIPIQFRYRPRHGEGKVRTVSPHVVVHVANRLHLRGWDHDRNAARDFLLTRMDEARPAGRMITYVEQTLDQDWWEEVEIEISIREDENVEAVRLDFALDGNGTRRRRIRKAHLQYLIDGTNREDARHFQSPVTIRQLS